MNIFYAKVDDGSVTPQAEQINEQNSSDFPEFLMDEETLLELEDPETGETYEFFIADEFDFEDRTYCVLLTPDEEDPQYLIARVVEEDGEITGIETLSADEEDQVYAAYDEILEEWAEEDEA